MPHARLLSVPQNKYWRAIGPQNTWTVNPHAKNPVTKLVYDLENPYFLLVHSDGSHVDYCLDAFESPAECEMPLGPASHVSLYCNGMDC